MATTSGFAQANSLELAYEEIGDPSDPAVLLIMGFGAQLTLWPDGFCEKLAGQGFRVIRFDNRDIGLSTKLDGQRVEGSFAARLARSQLGLASPVPYTLHDMADDTRGLLDALGISSAHVVGASMGGMITQLLAGKFPERVKSAAIIFSSTLQAMLPPPSPAAVRALLAPPPKNATKEDLIKHSMAAMRVIGSPGYPDTDEELRAKVARGIERSYYPAGMVRQFAAVTGTGSLRPFTSAIRCPSVVIHGKADPLVRPKSGKAVASAIKGSRLRLIEGMGHDLPEPLWSTITAEITGNIARASR